MCNQLLSSNRRVNKMTINRLKSFRLIKRINFFRNCQLQFIKIIKTMAKKSNTKMLFNKVNKLKNNLQIKPKLFQLYPYDLY